MDERTTEVMEAVNDFCNADTGNVHRLVGWMIGEDEEFVAATLEKMADYDRRQSIKVAVPTASHGVVEQLAGRDAPARVTASREQGDVS